MVRVRCSHCTQVYHVSEDKLGSKATCKKCQHTFTLQMSADETTAPQARSQSTVPPSVGSTALPRKLGQYLLKKKLGSGAMGDVWLAHDATLERDAALKLMSPGIASDPERRQRFEREAKTAARLLHPNTVAIYSFGVEGQHAYLAMELVNGSSLDRVVAESGPLPWREATRAICDAARGLAAAHEIGLVHRDVKPANLMRTAKGVTKVVDFGLARAMASNTQLTQEGSMLGTPAYMAPEQWIGKEVDARSDLYSLVCTYYYLLTGKLPYDAPSLAALGYQHRYEPFPDPREAMPDLPDGVCRVLAKGAQKDAAGRYQSGDELVAELEAVLGSPDESLLFNSPWQSLYTPTGTAASPAVASGSLTAPPISVPVQSGAMPALAVPSLVVKNRTSHKRPPMDRIPLVWLALAGGGVMALLLGILIYVSTNKGTIKIELSDPTARVEVKVDGDRIELSGLAEPLRLTPREHELVVEGANFETVTKKFTVKRGSNPPLTIELVPHVAAAAQPGILPPAEPPTPAISTGPTTPPAAVPHTIVPSDAPADARQFAGHSYKFFAQHVSWKEAKAACESLKGHLVTIESAEEQKFVSDLVTAAAWQDCWIGITDEAREGTWLTVTGQPLAYTNWFTNQPNNKGAGEHFGIITNRLIAGGINWQWCDQPSQALSPHQPGYMCEWEPSSSAATATTSEGWVSLFNGKDLTGWKTHPDQPGGWTVENGLLVGRSTVGNHLFSERADYDDFHLRAELKLGNQSNSGIYFRSNFGVDRNGMFPRAYEAQLVNQDSAGPLTGSLRLHGGGQADPSFLRSTIAPDEWFTIEVIAKDDHLTVKVNGRITCDVVDSEKLYRSGHLVLQAMNRNSVVHFRKIEIKDLSAPPAVVVPPPLPATPAPPADGGWVSLFNGKDLTGWKTHPADTTKWEVTGGILRGNGARGCLYTVRDDYEDFHFRVEAQINDTGNSGQYFRAAFGPGFPPGYEAQISTAQSDQKTGSLYGLVKIPQQLHRPNEWFTQEVIARGNRITILVNGKQIVDFEDPNRTYARGHLALQHNTVGAGEEFRKVEVKELKSGAPLPQLVPLSELNTPASEEAAWVSPDGLRIYFEKASSGEDPTIWQAERPSPREPFRNSRLVALGRQPTLTPDELQIVGLRRGGPFGKSLFAASRPSRADDFNLGSELRLMPFDNFGFNNPCISADGLALFVNGRDGGPIEGTQYFVSRRMSLQSPWSPLTALDVKWDVTAQGAPLTWLAMAPDELSFLATHELDIGRFRIVRFTRAKKTDPFENFDYLALPGIDPLHGRAPRYVPATQELFLTAPPDFASAGALSGWQSAPPDLWVIQNVRLEN